jgi:integrase
LPELLSVVQEWDHLVRSNVGLEGYWYALIDRDGMTLRKGNGTGNPVDRRRNFARWVERLCALARIPYRRPHCLRHGHAVYGMKHARNIQDLKAVSQNLMHTSISVTDGLYGRLSSDDVNRAITHLGSDPVQPAGDMNTLLLALAKLQANPELLQTVLSA